MTAIRVKGNGVIPRERTLNELVQGLRHDVARVESEGVKKNRIRRLPLQAPLGKEALTEMEKEHDVFFRQRAGHTYLWEEGPGDW